ncbi:MAG: DUF2723 domain-containing protein [Deltaproteobacteria bacterium]|nr:MAG: DUF2723 domain-containing protein [Deltaproteobacteria bacterium]
MDRARVWLPRAIAVAAFAMYALAAPPSLYWRDAGELGAAAIGLGSPHPTGFPLYMALAKLASLIPLGELAYRVHLLSAICAAAGVWCVGRIALDVRDDAAAVAGACAGQLALALSLVWFRHATTTEVYAPTGAALALTLRWYARVARGGGPRTGLALAWLAGLGAGLHASYRLLLAVPIAALLFVRLRRGARWPLWTPALAVAAAAAVHAYLPVRSASGRAAALDWGHPRTAAAFVDHAVTARRIRVAYADEIGVRMSGLRRAAAQAADHLGPLALLAAVGGLVWAFAQRRERWLAAALAAVGAGDLAYSAWLNPRGLVDLQNGVPLAVAVAIATALGVAWFARATGRAAPFAGAAVAVWIAVPIALVGGSARWAAAAGDAPRRWGEAALADVGPRGVVLARSDDTASALFFLSLAEMARPDVAVLVRQHLWDVDRNRAVLARARAPVDPVHPVAALAAQARPVGWELGADRPPPGIALRAGPVVATWQRGPVSGVADVRAAARRLARVLAGPDGADPNAARAHAAALVSLGRLAYARGEFEAAGALFRAAAAVRPDHVAAWVNLGVVADRLGRYREAAELTERALALAPDHAVARVNAARFWLRAGDDARARYHAERAVATEPTADALAIAGILDARAGRFDRARRRLVRALQLDPNHADARDNLARLPPPRAGE